jgi:hypothetical protein
MDRIIFRRGFVGVIHEIDLVHVMKSCQSVQSLFIVDLGHLNDCEKFCHCGESFRGLQYLSLGTKINLISFVVLEIWFF